ncbi:MAG: tetratricopeptide repeat protein [Lewinella sp.]
MKRFYSLFLVSFLLAVFAVACTPQAAGPASTETSSTAQTPTAQPTANEGEALSDCPKFTDAPNPDDAETKYVIYRNALKAREMERAMDIWREVYATSPAADGRRPTVYTDGVEFYNYLIQENPDMRETYGDSILMLYEQARECYPSDGYMAAIQGFDSYYTYAGSTSDEDIYGLFKESIEMDGPEELQYFVINPMSRLVVDQHESGNIDESEAKEIVTALKARLEKGLADCSGADCEAWKAIEAYAPSSLQYFETVKGFYDCQYYIDEYYPEFEANPEECDAITTAYGRMRWATCAEDLPEYQKVKAAYEANCEVVAATSSGGASTIRQAYEALRNNQSSDAVRLFEQAADETEDNERKSLALLTAAKIYYRDLRNFSQARAYARRSAEADPSNGEPYMLIGTLYASSGPLCGPGTGFDSQVVVWPAIDMWQRAKSVDPSVAAKANQLIGRYTQYMPSRADVFQRGIEVGSTYTVGCWIQESTRVRTP